MKIALSEIALIYQRVQVVSAIFEPSDIISSENTARKILQVYMTLYEKSLKSILIFYSRLFNLVPKLYFCVF